ncbi:cytochrome-c oxidase [Salinarimonas ramus]|uniref:Cytochrome C and Quinol oxidase polypeptide I n=1 Tax=Salinarimonas ramus TaxID=690164 RepID=A0A917V541_9HYPH|nr:cytochrome-c oxidase [Salinarimonas ramus]GGK37897.1 hypothetical protein GCM10011322_26170 [Salinarimonas ramus]
MTTLSNRFFRAAFVFFGIGIALGIGMSLTHDFTFRPVHVHVNLIGWVGFFLYGAFYRLFPEEGGTRLAQAHFWSALVGLPPMVSGLGFLVSGMPAIGVPLLLAGEAVTVLSVVLFLVVGFKATRTAPALAERAPRVEPRSSAL